MKKNLSDLFTLNAKTTYSFMKKGKLLAIGLLFIGLGMFNKADATARTWTGSAGDNIFNTAGNWNPSGTPTSADALTMTMTGGTISLNGDITVGSLTITNGGNNNVFTLNPVGFTLTITGAFSANNTSGNNNTNLIIGGATFAGTIDIGGAASFGTTNSGNSVQIQGNTTTSTLIFSGNVTFGIIASISATNTTFKEIFDGSGTQTVTWNNTGFFCRMNNVDIGSTNNPTVTQVTGTATPDNILGNLTINGSSILNLGTSQWNRNSNGGTFAINNTATLQISAASSVLNGGTETLVAGSNFPSGFTTNTLNTTSTVEYNAAGSTNQTIYATPTYGNLTLSRVSGATNTNKTASAAITAVGNLTISAGATFVAGTSLSHNVGGNWVNNGAFSWTTGNTITFNTAGQKTISGSTTSGFDKIIVNKGTDTSNIIEATGLITMTNGGLTLTNGVFKLSSASTIVPFTAGPTIAATAGLWNNGGTMNQAASFSWTVNGLFRSSGGTTAIGAASGNQMGVPAGGMYSMQGGTVSFSGRLVGTGGTFIIIGGTGKITTVGNVSTTNAGLEWSATTIVTMTGGTFEFQNNNTGVPSSATTGGDLLVNSGAGAKSITGGLFQIGNASTPSASVFLINSAVTISNVTVFGTNNPTARLRTNNLVMNGTMTLNSNVNGLDVVTNTLNVTLAGNWINNGATFNSGAQFPGTSTITFNSTTGAQTLGGTQTPQSFYNITVSNTGQTLSGGGSLATLNVANTMTLSSGTLAAGTITTINMTGNGGNWTSNGGTFSPGSSTVNFNNTVGGQAINGTAASQSFNSITVAKTAQSLSIGGSCATLNMSGTMTLTSGTFNAGTATSINMTGSGGNWTNNGGSFTVGSSIVTFSNTSGAQAINGTAASQTFNGITVNKSGQTLSVAGSTTTLNIGATLTLSAGTFDAGTATSINMTGSGGNWTNNGGSFTPGSSTVTFNNAAGPQAINGTGTTDAFNNLTINKSGQTLSVSGSINTLNISGSVSFNNGTFDAGTAANINMTGNGGNWNCNTGAFTPQTSTVTFNNTAGLQQVGGVFASLTFYNLTIAKSTQTLLLAGAISTYNVTGTLTISSGTLQMGGSSSDLMVGGDWVNNGTFNNGSVTVTFNSSSTNQNLSGTTATAFNYLVLNKASGKKVILSGTTGISINNSLTLTLGTLQTNANTVTLASAATISEAAGQTVLGNLTKTKVFSSPDNFGGMGMRVTEATALGSTTVTRVTGTDIAPNGLTSILRYFDVTPTINTGLNSTVELTYDNNSPASELNGNVASGLKLYSTDDNVNWTEWTGSIVAGSTVSITGITQFSRWTATSSCFNWSGAVSTDWSIAGNWECGNVPNSSTAIVSIPSGKPRYPVITGAQSFSVRNITVSGAASLTINGTLNISGVFNNSGTITATSGTINYNGTGGAQNISGNIFSGNTLKGLTISNSAGATITSALTLTDVLSFGNVNNVTLATGAFLTLHSDSTNTARIADLTNNSANSGNTITGDVSVERWMRAGTVQGGDRAYRLITPSVNTSTTIHDNWQEGAVSKTDNPNPGYGTHITGSTLDQQNGFDATYTAQPSLYTFNGTGWLAASNTDAATLSAKTGYLLFVRGDRYYDLNQPQPGPFTSYSTTLRAKGAVLTGTQTFTGLSGVPAANILVTNPFASPIDWLKVYGFGTNVTNYENSINVWDPHVGTRGGYVTIQDLAGTPVITGGGASTQEIQGGEAFFLTVKTGASVPSTFTVMEQHKSTTNNLGVFTPTVQPARIDALLYFNDAILGRRLADGVIALYGSSFSAGIDGNDADQLSNMDEDIAILRNNHQLSIETRPLITSTDTLFIYMQRMKSQNYEWELRSTSFDPSLTAELVDNYTGTRTPLDLSSNTTLTFNVNTGIAGSKASNRFYIVFNPSAPLPVTLNSIRAYEVPPSGGRGSGINVDWSVSQQLNMDRYEVEKSVTGNNFSKAGTVGASATNGAANYTWFDAAPNMGANFYRIRMIGKDGATGYSQVVKVIISKGAPAITVYPNPITGNTVTLQMTNLDKGIYAVTLTNKLGQVVFNKDLSHAGGSATQTIDLDRKLAQGTYQLKVTGDGGTFTMQVIKQEGN